MAGGPETPGPGGLIPATTLVVTNDFPPRIGGIESFVSDVCELLDHDVVVYASGPPGSAATDLDRGYPVVRDGGLLLPTPRTAARASDLLRRHGATRVVFGAAAPLGLLATGLRRAGATNVLGLTHGHETWWATVPGARRALRRIGDHCDHLTTISAYTEGRIRPALSPEARSRVVRLAPPVDLDRFRPGPRGDRAAPPRCVAVGRFVVQKGFDTLLRAWRLLLDDWPAPAQRPELTLVGDGPQRDRLETLVDDLRLRPTVRFTGALARPQVITELQRSDVFALPVRTRRAGLNAEGLGLAAIEAAACGLPVIIGRSGGAPETVRPGETGQVVEPDDVPDLARQLGRLLGDRDQARRMGALGRTFVAQQFGPASARLALRRALEL